MIEIPLYIQLKSQIISNHFLEIRLQAVLHGFGSSGSRQTSENTLVKVRTKTLRPHDQ